MSKNPAPVDASRWSKRNLWRLPSGEIAVRPGLRKLEDVAGTGRLIAPGAFTIRNDFAGGEVRHYLVCPFDDSGTNRNPRVFIQDENFATVFSMDLSINVIPRVVTYGVVQGQIIIASPDFPTLHGIVGGGLHLARLVDSEDTTTTAIERPDVPRGVVTSWVGTRTCIGSGRDLFVSDAVTAFDGDPRTYVGENQTELPGVIYGLHESGNGTLVAVTDVGVYGLDSSAASVALIGDSNTDWRLLNHHTVSGYGQSCVVRGRVWALSQRGVMLVDEENDNEVVLNESMMTMTIGAGRYALEDFRSARIIAGEHGPIVGVDSLGAVVMTDFSSDTPVITWWKASEFAASAPNYGQSSFTGTLRDVDGTPLYCGSHGVYRLEGDFDGTQLLSSFTTAHTGSMRGLVDSDPSSNARVKYLYASCAIGGGAPKVYASYMGVAPTGVVPTLADSTGLTIGSDSWGTTSKHYAVTPLSSVRFQFGTNAPPSNELAFEFGCDEGLARINPNLGVDFGDSAPMRPKNTG